MRNLNGFSLIELNLAIVFTGLTLPILLGYFIDNNHQFSQADLSYQAGLLAKSKMEEIIALCVNDDEKKFFLSKKNFSEEVLNDFKRQLQVKPIMLNSISGYEVVVRVFHPKMIKDVQLYRFFLKGRKYHDEENE